MLSRVSFLNKITGLRFLKLQHNSNNLSLIKNAMSVFPPSHTISLRYHNCERVIRNEILVGVWALKCICLKVVLWKNEKKYQIYINGNVFLKCQCTTEEMCMVTSQIQCLPVSQLRGDRGICMYRSSCSCKAAVISWLFKLLIDMQKLNA